MATEIKITKAAGVTKETDAMRAIKPKSFRLESERFLYPVVSVWDLEFRVFVYGYGFITTIRYGSAPILSVVRSGCSASDTCTILRSNDDMGRRRISL